MTPRPPGWRRRALSAVRGLRAPGLAGAAVVRPRQSRENEDLAKIVLAGGGHTGGHAPRVLPIGDVPQQHFLAQYAADDLGPGLFC